MHLEKLEIQGFKSFAQKTELAFPPAANATTYSIACIVGPNGSGKSNTVDAVRWVLGEQSLKNLRGKRSEDVIFSGSEKKTRLGMAYVAMHIDNSDGRMPVDYKEVVISRKLYRNGESEYRINNSKVRLQDILLMLAKANFGQKSYSIVSQGTIDQVIMASASERKEYFDEAVGVREFQIKRDQSINKLENAWNNLRQVDALLTEITPRLNSLTRQVKRLERREQVEKELREVSEGYYGFLWSELEQKMNQVKPQLTEKEAVLRQHEKSLGDLQAHLRKLEKEESGGSGFTDLQQAYQKILHDRNKLREEQLMLQNKIELAKQRIIDTAAPMAMSEILGRLKAIQQLEEKVFSQLDTTDLGVRAQVKEDLRELSQLIKELVHELEHPKMTTKASADVDPQLQKDLVAVGKDLEAIEKRLSAASEAIAEYNQTEQQKKGKFFDLQRQITAAQDGYNKASNQVSELRVEQARLETRLADLKQEVHNDMGSAAWLASHQAKRIDEHEAHENMKKLKHQLELIGGVDPEVVKEYEEIKTRHDFLSGQAEDLRKSITDLEKVITELDEKIQEQFDSAFKHINREFDHFFKILFGGGKANLNLLREDEQEVATALSGDVDGETITEQNEELGILDRLTQAEEKLSPKRFLKKRTGKVITGIDIIATPPGKKVSAISMLSGGERSLASIALICAVIANNPSPFVILDEVDAALDEANSQRFAKILTELAHKTQFVVITHNRATMQVADVLYGVTMGDDGISRLISLKFEEAEKVVRQ